MKNIYLNIYKPSLINLKKAKIKMWFNDHIDDFLEINEMFTYTIKYMMNTH